MATADTTDKNMVRKSVRHKYFSPPWGGFCNFGMIVIYNGHSLGLKTQTWKKYKVLFIKIMLCRVVQANKVNLKCNIFISNPLTLLSSSKWGDLDIFFLNSPKTFNLIQLQKPFYLIQIQFQIFPPFPKVNKRTL